MSSRVSGKTPPSAVPSVESTGPPMNDLTTLRDDLENERRLRKKAEDQIQALDHFMEKKMVEFEAYGQKVAEAVFDGKPATVKMAGDHLAEIVFTPSKAKIDWLLRFDRR